MRVSWKCRFVQQLIFRRYFWVGNRKKRKEPNSRKNKTLVVDTAQRHYREDTLFLVSIWRKRMHNHHHLTLTLRNDPNFVRNGGRFTVRLCVCFCVMTQNRKKLKKNSSCKRTRRPYGRAATDDKSRFDTESRYEGCDVAITKFLVVRKRRLAVEEFQRPEATTFQRPSQLNGLVRTQLFCFFLLPPAAIISIRINCDQQFYRRSVSPIVMDPVDWIFSLLFFIVMGRESESLIYIKLRFHEETRSPLHFNDPGWKWKFTVIEAVVKYRRVIAWLNF